jgi:hypothetical protein
MKVVRFVSRYLNVAVFCTHKTVPVEAITRRREGDGIDGLSKLSKYLLPNMHDAFLLLLINCGASIRYQRNLLEVDVPNSQGIHY